MGDKEDYLTLYRLFFENFAATVNPEDQLPVQIAGYTITEAELPGEVLYWTTQYLTEKQCPPTLMTPLRRIILDEVQVACKKQPNEFGYKSDSSVYIALRLMQAVTARVNDVCLRYLDNSRLDTLPPPPPLALRELKTVSSATKNSRRVMEDRHVEIGNLEALFGIDTTEPTSFYAVYDGHAGSAAATYCAAHLHQYLVESPHFTTDLRRALLDAFLKTDAEFVSKSNQERARGGSTAVAVTVRARRLHAAWAGDSLALLAKRMRLMQLVRPHKPGRQDERDRIESSGGTVMHWGTWRVNGQLAVSRAIGDAQYKPYVTARPEIATVELDGDEDFVVVACDGLWDFVSEDDVALAVYIQLASDPDDLKAVTKRLTVQAKRQGSSDNISIIVVFLKDPRDIAADNCPPMDLGLDNALANAPPFAVEMDACKRQLDAAAVDANSGECADTDADADAADNGVDNSDSDSEDLGPETAVDADDVDAEPAPPTPPAHTVEAGHVDGALLDNVAESGDESEDEWNYFKGEGDREGRNRVEEPDEPPRSETPCQDNSESSSIDMNSSPLNPDAPVFVPGNVASSDVLLAESPRKPMPMDDIELPDVAQFQTEAVVRPAELLDLDNCDQLNGHHNVSVTDADKKHLNGNDKCNMDSLGFGFGVGVEPEKLKDTNLIQDFERIQKDTTDFVNIQVFQSHTEANPFAGDDNEELFERLKNKERDPMSMSFYQEKDDDTCERLVQNESHVDLNAVQPLPDSDDEDIQPNGVCEDYNESEKENISPEQHTNLLNTNNIQEPNNDIIQLDDRTDTINIDIANFGQSDNFISYNTNNMQNYSNIDFEPCNIPQETVLQTDTPESHKLLFEQIPEIPDGKSSELGFVNEDTQDPSESEKDIRVMTPQDEMSQDVDMESKLEDSPCIEETQSESTPEPKEEQIEPIHISESEQIHSPEPEIQTEILSEQELLKSSIQEEHKSLNSTTPEPTHDLQENVVAEIHHTEDPMIDDVSDQIKETPTIQVDYELNTESAIAENVAAEVPLPAESPLSAESPVPPRSPAPGERPPSATSPVPNEAYRPSESQVPAAPSPAPVDAIDLADSPVPLHSPLPTESLHAHSPLPTEDLVLAQSPVPADSPLPSQWPLPTESHIAAQSPLTTESPAPAEVEMSTQSLLPTELSLPARSPLPTESPVPTPSPLPTESLTAAPSPLPAESAAVHSPLPTESPAPVHSPLPMESPAPVHSPLPTESPAPVHSPLPTESPVPVHSPLPTEAIAPVLSPLPTEVLAPAQSPIPSESPLPTHSPVPTASPLPPRSPLSTEECRGTSPLPAEVPLPRESPSPSESPVPVEALLPVDPTLLPIQSSIPAESPVPVEPLLPKDLSLPVEATHPSESPLPTEFSLRTDTTSPQISSPVPNEVVHVTESAPLATSPAGFYSEKMEDRSVESRLTPEIPQERPESEQETLHVAAGPTPDLVPEARDDESQTRSELVTDIDIGIPESRAQEICVPVTSEIEQEEVMQPAAGTPPPTPAVEPPQPPASLDIPPLSDTPIAADESRDSAPIEAVAAGVAAAAAAATVAAVAATAAKSKTPTTKKSPTTPTPAVKSATKPTATSRTPVSAAKKLTATTTAKTPTSATKLTPTAKTTTMPSRPSAVKSTTPKAPTPRPAAKSSPVPVKETAVASKAATATRAAPAARAAPKPAAPRPAAASKTTAPRPATAPAPKPVAAPKTAPSRPATATRPAAPARAAPATRPAPRPAPLAAKPKDATTKPADKKPLTNGDVKAPVKKTAPTTTRAAPRVSARAPVATGTAAPAKLAAPKPAPRAAAPRPALDKQTKDLANKRITAKAAPPRTAATKASLGVKSAATKPTAIKRSPAAEKPAAQPNGLPNGAGDMPVKPPASPPVADNALLPDVIA